MNGVKSLFVILAVSGGIAGVAIAQAVIPNPVKSALADPGRPAEDVARDMIRKPAQLVAFAGIKPNDQVVDFIPGGGYFTRIFSGVVGPGGHVYAMVPKPAEAMEAKLTTTITSFAAAHPNVSVVIAPLGQYTPPGGPADVFWTSQNYHDLYNAIDKSTGKGPDLVAFNKLVYAALKPGGDLHRGRSCGAGGLRLGGHQDPPPDRSGSGEGGRPGGGLHVRGRKRRLEEPGRSTHRPCVRPVDPRPHRSVRLQVQEAELSRPTDISGWCQRGGVNGGR